MRYKDYRRRVKLCPMCSHVVRRNHEPRCFRRLAVRESTRRKWFAAVLALVALATIVLAWRPL